MIIILVNAIIIILHGIQTILAYVPLDQVCYKADPVKHAQVMQTRQAGDLSIALAKLLLQHFP